MIRRSVFLALALSVAVSAQQLEPNTPGGSLTINGQGPTGVGSPIGVGSTAVAALAVGGASAAPYTLLAGSLSPVSIPVGPEFADISLFGFTTIVDGIGINLTPAGFPSGFGFLNGAGVGTWSFGLNANLIGAQVAFQGVVVDVGSPIGINLTGCPEMLVAPFSITFSGDDTLNEVTLNNPLSLYGFSSAQIGLTTNGYLTLGHTGTFADLSETNAEFLAGTAGGSLAGSAPVVACLWEDLDVGNVVGQNITAVEVTAGVLQVTWTGDFFPAVPMGTISCTIDSNAQQITFDYTGYTAAVPPTEGIVGVSDGGTTGLAVAAQIDLAIAGVVNYTSGAGPESVFQNFDATGAFSQPFDLGGLVLTFTDLAAGGGLWLVQ